MDRSLVITGIYKHFKGDYYRVLDIVKHSETKEEMVLYQALYGNNQKWVRPADMFTSKVDKNKYHNAEQEYRFELVTGKKFADYDKYMMEKGHDYEKKSENKCEDSVSVSINGVVITRFSKYEIENFDGDGEDPVDMLTLEIKSKFNEWMENCLYCYCDWSRLKPEELRSMLFYKDPIRVFEECFKFTLDNSDCTFNFPVTKTVNHSSDSDSILLENIKDMINNLLQFKKNFTINVE